MAEPRDRGFQPIAPIVQLVRTGLDKTGQNAEMALQGFVFGLLDLGHDSSSLRTRSVRSEQFGSWGGSWRLPIALPATVFSGLCRRLP